MASLQSSSESHLPQLLTIADSNSPEFEFWNILRNPSFPPPNLLSADELFADGVVLPLHRLQIHFNQPPDDPIPHPDYTESSSSVLAASKRWRDIFKKTDKKLNPNKTKKEKAVAGGKNSSAELNINIWPFSRSRSAGTGGNRTRTSSSSAVVRKVSSAPCSRSNSRGESNSKGRKLLSSPSRGGGVHLGRSSPVLHIRRGGSGRKGSDPNSSINRIGQKGSGMGSSPRLASMDCRQNTPATCGGDEKSRGIDGAGAVDGGGRSSNNQLFNLKSLFSKKVY
ncbi:uncharacterized protein LOC124926881 [Impatiens glandulifera]|uniref:uncharacterized protein LOC124926881 n=1 Tax=Impatiens glandulifera TaxID=253017 RepID=UPI001FB14AE7|nr:uncharacterized protein LOC124926881 [Impatiens glandulifera]